MATATQKARTAQRTARRIEAASGSRANKFDVFEDNAGEFRWSILDSRGESLAQSRPFGNYDAARAAAGVVHDEAGSWRFEELPKTAGRPVDLLTPAKATRGQDDSDAERWLDEGGGSRPRR